MLKKYDTARQVTCDYSILHMTFAWWTPKATQTLRICNTYCFFTVTMFKRTRLYITLYAHCLSCCFLFHLPTSPIPLSPPNYSKIFHYTGVHFQFSPQKSRQSSLCLFLFLLYGHHYHHNYLCHCTDIVTGNTVTS